MPRAENGVEKKRDVLEESAPGLAYMPFLIMEYLLDKLKLLSYDTEFCKEYRVKPLNRHYFAIPTNPGEQFFMFASLSAWLIQKCGYTFERPQEYDDPNSTISNILDILRQLNVTIDFPPSRLKPGCGEEVVFVLDSLADEALKASKFSWKRPIHPAEEEEEEVFVDDDVELTLDKVEEEMIEEDEEEEEEMSMLDLNVPFVPGRDDRNKPEDILESKVDSAEWKLEVEKVLPELKVTVRADTKEWRSRIDQMHHHRKEIQDSLSLTLKHLDKLHADVGRTLEKINSREKYLNSQLEHHLLEYRAAQDQLSQAKENYRSVSGGVTQKSRILAQLTEELEQIKQEMDEKGSSMTDGTPLVNIRKALARLKNEIASMDVRIGVAMHTLLQSKVKEKGNFQRRSSIQANNTEHTTFG